MLGRMHIVQVFCRVKPGAEQAFIAVTSENSRCSNEEPGVARFDVLQDVDDASRFTLIEVYHSAGDVADHKLTAHYAAWVAAMEDLLAEPRSRVIYRNVAPGDDGWA